MESLAQLLSSLGRTVRTHWLHGLCLITGLHQAHDNVRPLRRFGDTPSLADHAFAARPPRQMYARNLLGVPSPLPAPAPAQCVSQALAWQTYPNSRTGLLPRGPWHEEPNRHPHQQHPK
jgi:hypothetical protein